jgi:hypothetical protein
LLDGFSFDLFPPFENGLAAPEVDVSRRQVVQALLVSTVVVVADELLDAVFELSWQDSWPKKRCFDAKRKASPCRL